MDTELNALMSLLNDPDEQVFLPVRAKLIGKGGAALSYLSSFMSNCADPLARDRLIDIVNQLQTDDILDNIKNWSLSEPASPLDAAFLVAKYIDHQVDNTTVFHHVAAIANDVHHELAPSLTPLEKVKVLNHIFFKIHHFRGDHFLYPANSLLDQVLMSKKGGSVLLAILYAHVARQFGIPLYGVDLPINFILAYKNTRPAQFRRHFSNDDVLFYVNPFNNGAVFGRREIDYFIQQQRLTEKEVYYRPTSSKGIVLRLVNDLAEAYKNNDEPERQRSLEAVRRVLV